MGKDKIRLASAVRLDVRKKERELKLLREELHTATRDKLFLGMKQGRGEYSEPKWDSNGYSDSCIEMFNHLAYLVNGYSWCNVAIYSVEEDKLVMHLTDYSGNSVTAQEMLEAAREIHKKENPTNET